MKYDEQKAIELGKIWMKNSLNISHDFEHASNVLEHMLNIFPHFKDLDENLVQLAAWWHDCYKARRREDNIFEIFMEGIFASRMFEKEVGQYIKKDRMKRVSRAILVHNNPIPFVIFKRWMDPLATALMEADRLDEFNLEKEEREERYLVRPGNILFRKLWKKISPIFLKLIVVSPYSKEKAKLFLKNK